MQLLFNSTQQNNMLFVFDLDFTLWDCDGTWCDHTQPPYKKQNGIIYDNYNRGITLYPDVLDILNQLKNDGIEMALASRTSASSWAKELLELFNIDKFFRHKEIYPGSKLIHFRELHKKTIIGYEKMFFFDDEYRNIDEVQTLDVNCFFVKDGLNFKIINKALKLVV